MNQKQLKRLLELSNIKGTSMKESTNRNMGAIELIKKASDGNTYAIVRENRNYYIKSTTSKTTLKESDFNYIGGVQNKNKHSYHSFEDATFKLNLIFNDINRNYGIKESVDMKTFDYVLTESGDYKDVDEKEEDDSEILMDGEKEELQEKKFVLKQPKPKKKEEPSMDFGDDSDEEEGDTGEEEFDFGDEEEGDEEFDFGSDEEEGDTGEEEFDFGDEEEGDTGEEEFDFGDEEETDTEEGEEEFDFGDEEEIGDEGEDVVGDDPIKDIQRTTGKLGQQLRDTEDLSSDMQKYVVNSVLSALDLSRLDSNDKDSIINKIESGDNPKEEVDFMDDDYERGGEPELESGEELLYDTSYMSSEYPAGYLGYLAGDDNKTSYMDDDHDIYDPRAERQAEKDMSSHYNKPSFDEMKRGYKLPNNTSFDDVDLEGPMVYMSDDDFETCDYEGNPVDEGMTSWKTEDSSGIGWKTENVDYMVDNDDIYGMNSPKPKERPSTKPGTRPGTKPGKPRTRPSTTPFTPPDRDVEPAPAKAENESYMDDPTMSPSPARPKERPSTKPGTRPGTKPGKPRTRPSTTPFTPPDRDVEPAPAKAENDDDVTFE